MTAYILQQNTHSKRSLLDHMYSLLHQEHGVVPGGRQLDTHLTPQALHQSGYLVIQTHLLIPQINRATYAESSEDEISTFSRLNGDGRGRFQSSFHHPSVHIQSTE